MCVKYKGWPDYGFIIGPIKQFNPPYNSFWSILFNYANSLGAIDIG